MTAPAPPSDPDPDADPDAGAAPLAIAPVAIALGADHAGFALKDHLAARLRAAGHAVLDCGTSGPDSVDYPDYAHRVAEALESGAAGFGLLVCGSGIGMSIAANRHAAIRCALVNSAEAAGLARAHNNANVLALGARLIDAATAEAALRTFLATAYEGGRHDRRLAKLAPASGA
ncbi:MAG: ribose 5-phosphate isomerase B [Rhodospirillales bacterium]|nr:ribose 5-phosphate isomerase B [Rhodospirillales bacterium]